MKNQILICSYAKDFEWLMFCLESLNKYAKGFLPPVVCVAQEDVTGARITIEQFCPDAILKVFDGKPGQGFMRAQIAMMRGDELCPDADNIFFLGSDCIATDTFEPGPYLAPDGRPAVLYTLYPTLKDCHADALPWKAGVERVLQIIPPAEYMRRLPSVFPRTIFAPMRAMVSKIHNRPFDEYIYLGDLPYRDTSEANILGAYAHRFMPETCLWVDIATQGLYGCQVNGWPTVIAQFWSHGGLDRPVDCCFEYRGKSVVGRTARDIINEILHANPTPTPNLPV